MKILISKLFFILIMVFFSQHLYAREKLKVAVIDFKPVNVPIYYASIVKTDIESFLINSKDFVLIERSYVDIVFNEMQLKRRGCDIEICKIEVARSLSADILITGTVQGIGGEKKVTIKIINVNNSKIVSANVFSFKDDKEIKGLVDKAAGNTAKDIQKFDITKQGVDRRYEVYMSASFNYAVPYMSLRSILSNGYGFNLNFGLKNDNFLFGLEAGFSIFKGWGDYTQAKFFPILLNVGYNINIFNFLSVTPVVGFGASVNINSYKYYYIELQRSREIIHFNPLLKGHINFDFSINSFVKLQIGGGSSVFIDKSKIFSYLDFKIGTMVIF